MDFGVIAALVVLIAFLLFGVHIHTTLFAVGIVGIWAMGMGDILPTFLGTQTFPSVASYALTTIPMFVLAAQFILGAGIIDDMYNAVYNMSKGKKGPLAYVTVILGALLGAVCGVGTASASALGKVAVPQLKKHGYDYGIAGAIAAVSGGLSAIIPPSIVIVVYGIIAETSISQMFAGAILPGIIIVGIYISFIAVYNKLRENKLKREGKLPDKQEEFHKIPVDKKRARISLIFGLLIIVIIFGGIYSGFCTPTEAGALAALVGFIAALVLKKVNKKFIIDAAVDTLRTSSMIMVIMVAAKVLGKFISLSQLARDFIRSLEPLMGTPELVLFIMLGVYFLGFMLMDGTAVILMTTPFMIPLITEMGYDPVWFGVLVCILLVLGAVTPPVGIDVYAVSGVSRIAPKIIFKPAMAIAGVTTIIIGAIMIFWPEVALLLPRLIS